MKQKNKNKTILISDVSSFKNCKSIIIMKKYFYLFAVLSIFLGFSAFASAASIFDITYPIDELGGCASQQECKTYCDDLANKDSCLAFAEKNGFISKEK